uniref:Homeobox domain-containing protein n=1 Tax=Cyprinus carpio TaxID=7962 RepID=A0A8C2HN74_CYPCA
VPHESRGLTPQVPVHLPPVEAELTPDLSQFYQQQLNPAMLQQQSKRPRTRITDDQLRILRLYFDINNSPNEDQIHEMANKSDLPHKVIKHWFRNTLFKERQHVKMDSRPPSPEQPRQEIYGSKRTTITPEQLEVLYQKYLLDSNPTRKMLDHISNEVGLKKRVVQVWFQNTRARERKGQFRALGPSQIHRRC